MAPKANLTLVKSATPAISQPQFNVKFETSKFDDAVLSKGYDIYHEKALRCPCINRNVGDAMPSCKNCGGIGYFYVEKNKTKALFQGVNSSPKGTPWTEHDSTTARITMLAADGVCYFDRLTNTQLLTTFNQAAYIRKVTGRYVCFTIYPIIEVYEIYLFLGEDSPLLLLRPHVLDALEWDYKILDNVVELNSDSVEVWGTDIEELTLSIRYNHHPVYIVTSLDREVFLTDSASATCGSKGFMSMPQKFTGRRAHTMPHANLLNGPYLHDNTNYRKYEKAEVPSAKKLPTLPIT